jgi:hypothetical protein
MSPSFISIVSSGGSSGVIFNAVSLIIIHFYFESRLTPVYAVILGFIATLLAYLGSGPNWQNVRILSVACRWNWWTNLLYINNYVRTFEMDVSYSFMSV